MEVDLSHADLRGAQFEGVDLHQVDLRDTDFSSADLGQANLQEADLRGACLKEARFVNAKLGSANFSGADLEGANFFGANLETADLSGANLRRADLSGANVTGTIFKNAKVNKETDLGNMDGKQFASLDLVVESDESAELSAESDAGESNDVIDITIGHARAVVSSATVVFSTLAIPNDLKEQHRDLILELQRTIEELEQELAKVTDENARLADQIDACEKVRTSFPIWKATWLTFVASAGGTFAASGIPGYAAGYTAGFIAGVLHDTFSPADFRLI